MRTQIFDQKVFLFPFSVLLTFSFIVSRNSYSNAFSFIKIRDHLESLNSANDKTMRTLVFWKSSDILSVFSKISKLQVKEKLRCRRVNVDN